MGANSRLRRSTYLRPRDVLGAARLQVEAKAELLLPVLNSGGEPATQMPKHVASVRHGEEDKKKKKKKKSIHI